MAAADLADALGALAVDVARAAGERIREALRTGRGAIDAKSTATDLVTETDRAVEALIVERIAAARPDDGFLGEEGADQRGTTGVRWIVDPIDGTTNFVYGYPAFCTSIAAEVDGAIVAGCVHDPVSGELFRAVAGAGAWLEVGGVATRLAVRPAGPPLAQALVATGFGYAADRRRAQAAILAEVLPQVRDVRRGGSCALDLCSVAAGRLDAYYERGPHPWDVAAGGLIAAEAGASVGALERDLPLAGLHEGVTVLVARPDLLAALRAALEAAGAGGDLA